MGFRLPLWTLIPVFFLGGAFIYTIYQQRTPPMSLEYFLSWSAICSAPVLALELISRWKKK